MMAPPAVPGATCQNVLTVSVRSVHTSSAVAGAQVFVSRSDDPCMNYTLLTGSGGTCQFHLQKNAFYSINVSASGFHEYFSNFYFKKSEMKDIYLTDSSPPAITFTHAPSNCTYAPGQVFAFGVTIGEDESIVDGAYLFLDGAMNPMTVTSHNSYLFTSADLPAGTHAYLVMANNTLGLATLTNTRTFDILKDTPNITLFLNSTTDNVTAFAGEQVTINASSDADVNLKLYVNDSLILEGKEINTCLNFTKGTRELKIDSTETENYTHASKELFIFVTDIEFLNVSYSNFTYCPSSTLMIDAMIEGDLDVVQLNFSGQIHVMVNSSESSFHCTLNDLAAGKFFFNIIANDTQGHVKTSRMYSLEVRKAVVNYTLLFNGRPIGNDSLVVTTLDNNTLSIQASVNATFLLTLSHDMNITMIPFHPIILNFSHAGTWNACVKILDTRNYTLCVLVFTIARVEPVQPAERIDIIIITFLFLVLAVAGITSFARSIADRRRMS